MNSASMAKVMTVMAVASTRDWTIDQIMEDVPLRILNSATARLTREEFALLVSQGNLRFPCPKG